MVRWRWSTRWCLQRGGCCGDGGCKQLPARLPCCQKRERGAPKPKTTPLPLFKLLVVCSAVFVNQFGINMIFPFLPFMIHDFFPYLDKTELGEKAGYLGSSYFIGNLVGSLLWGWVSDKVGRRPVLLTGVIAILLTELLFGFSQNFTWAIIARLLWGILNGNIGVAKTYISEISDDTNQAKGFAVIGTCGGVARLLGAMVGGFLAQPANKYSALQFDIFCKYPYCLPCIVGGCMGLFSLLFVWLFLDETLKKPGKNSSDNNEDETSSTSEDSSSPPSSSDSGIELQMQAASELDSDAPLLEQEAGAQSEEEFFELEDSESVSDYDVSSDTDLLTRVRNRRRSSVSEHFLGYKKKFLQIFSFTKLVRLVIRRITDCVGGLVMCVVCFYTFDYNKLRRRPDCFKRTTSCHPRGVCSWRVIKLFRDRKVFLSILLYGVIAFLAILSNELLPLLLVTGHEHGGYDMDDSEIGIVLMAAAIFQLLFQFFLFPMIVKCLGYRHTYKFGCALYGISVILLPLSNRISGPVSSPSEDFSGSGSGSGSHVIDVPDNSSSFCGLSLYDNVTESSSVNVDSVSRIPARVWVVLLGIVVLLVMSRMITMTSVMVLISNSTVPATRGTVNGFGQAFAALGRMIGPIVGSPLFAWSENSGKGWPLNYHLAFDLTAVGAVGAIVLCLFLPASIEKKRDSFTTTSETVSVEVTSDLDHEPVSEPNSPVRDVKDESV